MTAEQAQAQRARHAQGADNRCKANCRDRWPCFHWLDADSVLRNPAEPVGGRR